MNWETHSCSVQGTLVTPNSAGAPCPVHPSNTVVVAGYQAEHILPDQLVFVAGNLVDPADMKTHACENGLPARDGVCANNGMGGAELVVDIQRRPSRRHDVVPTSLAGGLEHGLRTSCSQRLKEGFEGR